MMTEFWVIDDGSVAKKGKNSRDMMGERKVEYVNAVFKTFEKAQAWIENNTGSLKGGKVLVVEGVKSYKIRTETVVDYPVK